MEFWGVEVKSGEPLEVEPGDDMILHLSQACLGEVKKDKGNDSIYLFVSIGDQKLVLGTLSADKFPQISFDIVFEKKFELSHNWKNGSVYFSGYKSPNPIETDYSDSDSDLGEDLPLGPANNGKPEVQTKQAKPAAEKANALKPDSTAPKQKVKIVEPNADDDDDSSESESEDEDEAFPKADHDSDEESSDDDDSDDDESNEDEDEETPKKAVLSKKRPADSATKTPIADKKAKLVTPQKTDGKKGGGHVATPHPSKQAGKIPANNDKSKQQSPKSSGSFQCKSCSRSFNSDNALQSHSKAKHSAAN
ncbi:hypothetical protein L1049_009402 [Liquidambar formosana]|uniref:C2H2-type domain-containing protein n=1 Tax=Liquidambar formosana TaxID=63359 RepID=A0AAP0SC58_LIQFO